MFKYILSRRTFLKMALGTAFLSVSGFAYGHYFESTQVEITPIRLILPRLRPEFHGYRIVQISDIHLDYGQITSTYLAEIVGVINRLQPDLIAITGDFITAAHDGGPRVLVEDLVSPLSLLRPRDTTVAVLGNHDHEENPAMVQQVIRKSAMINVSNTVHTLRRGDAMLHIAGVDDVLEGQDRLDLVLDRLPPTGAAVLVVHEPDFADVSAQTGRFELQLSGHSHGGQIIFPFLGPPLLPPYARKYPLGHYQVGEMTLYTNRGLGMLPPKVRINCRPEITVFTLETA